MTVAGKTATLPARGTPEFQLMFAAYHEAGHVVAHLVCGLPLHEVRVWLRSHLFRAQTAGGFTALSASPDGGVDIDDKHAPQVMTSAAAGPAAEAVLRQAVFGETPEAARRATAPQLAADWKNNAVMAPYARLSKRQALAQAETLVRANWRAVDAVARELFTRRRLSGAQCRRIAAAAR